MKHFHPLETFNLICNPVVKQISISELDQIDISPIATLYVPPLNQISPQPGASK